MTDLIAIFTKAVAEDPKAAGVLMDEVAYLAMAEQIKAYAPLLDQVAYTQARTSLDRAKVGLARGYVSKASGGTYPDAQMNQIAMWMSGIDSWLEEVAKDGDTVERDGKRIRVRRDALGRFATVAQESKLVVGQVETSVTPAGPVRQRVTPIRPTGADDAQPQVWQPNVAGEDAALANFQGSAENAFKMAQSMVARLGSTHVPGTEAVLQDKSGRKHRITLQALADGELPDGMNVRNPITGIRLDAIEEGSPADQAISARGFNRMGLFERLLKPFDTGAGYDRLFEERKSGDPRLDKFLNRLQITGELLNTIDPTEKLHGPMVKLVGSYGPEAVRVLTPQVQRTAYRYRGTERTPDEALTDWFALENKDTLESAADAIDDGNESARSIASQIDDKGDDGADPLLQSIKYRAENEHRESPITGDALRLGVRSDLAAAELLKTLPKDALIGELSISSGHVLPSQGVLIDRDGDVVAQAVGFSDDHYLPFNLKNMGDLRGGQYVRTRQQGGLTGEDIWASVFHGARSATVASSSGVFRIEFAPDFRGARAMSDKAFSMYDRYLQILKAVDESNLYVLDSLNGADKEDIKRKVRRAHPNMKDSQLTAEFESAFNLAREKSASNELTTARLKAMNAEAAEEAKAENPQATAQQLSRRAEEIFNLKHDAARNAVVNRLNLNADGYQLALMTLQQQFPYFIRTVEYEPLAGPSDNTRPTKGQPMFTRGRADMGFLARRGLNTSIGPKPSRSRDSGYVKPGQLKLNPYNTLKEPPAQAPPEPPATTGTTGAPAASVPGAQATPGAAEQAPAPVLTTETASPAARMAVIKGRAGQDQKNKLVEAFVSNMTRLTKRYGVDHKDPDDAKWIYSDQKDSWPKENAAGVREWSHHTYADLTSAVGVGIKDKIRYFIGQPTSDSMRKALEDNIDAALDLFSRASLEDVKSAMAGEFKKAGLKEIIDENDVFSSETVDEAAEAIKQAVLDIVEFDALSNRFVDNTPEAVRTVTARAVSFDELTSLDSADAVRAYAESNAEVAALANVIGTNKDGKYLPLADMANRMSRYLEVLDKAPAVRAAVIAQDDDAMKEAEKKNLRGADQLADLGLTPEVLFDETSEPEWADYYEKLQKARTLIEVSRVFNAADFTEGRAGATQLPKVRPPWVADPKSVTKAFSSLRVLSADDPVSKAVAARRAAGLPWVPRRRSPR